jgi:hypothetical protein
MSTSEDQTVQRSIALLGPIIEPDVLGRDSSSSRHFLHVQFDGSPGLSGALERNRPALWTDAATGWARKRDLHGDGRYIRRPERLVHDPLRTEGRSGRRPGGLFDIHVKSPCRSWARTSR